MSWNDALLHHVQRSVERDFGVDQAEPDDDGDFGVPGADRPVWVRPMFDHDPPLVRVWTPAVFGVKRSAGLLREINDLNLHLRQVRVVYDDPVVLVLSEVEADSIGPGMIGRLVELVGNTCAHAGGLISAVYGGEAVFGVAGDVQDADLNLFGDIDTD